MPRWCALACCVFFFAASARSTAADLGPHPKSLDPRLQIELVAEQPRLVTPTGLDVDHRGRVFLIESNTHMRPEGYDRHPTDRLLILRDADADHRAEDVHVFADGFTHAMSVLHRPVWFDDPRAAGTVPAARVYVATRREIVLLTDTDGDDVADQRETIVRLETPGNYPHNALAGFATDALGWLYFGFGENLGEPFTLSGSDGRKISGTDAGNMYRCRLDGSELQEYAVGFWNPHASCVDGFGRLFTVDNDPDSRPPCRLLHVVPGGNYGYRFRNGRKGLHPFTSWNGEIPGTLPMVAGTGEAPSGILAYEHDHLPDEYIGNLLVTSWGDHRIDRFRLHPKGASFTSQPEPLIQGGENFRPVGIACAPDGSLYITDWVLRDYKLHQHGRVWRISAKTQAMRPPLDPAAVLTQSASDRLLESPVLPIRRAAATVFRQTPAGRQALKTMLAEDRPVRTRLEALWSLAQVPTETEDLKLTAIAPGQRLIRDQFDDVVWALFDLLGTPQFPYTDAFLRQGMPTWPRPGSSSPLPATWGVKMDELQARTRSAEPPHLNCRPNSALGETAVDPFRFQSQLLRLSSAPARFEPQILDLLAGRPGLVAETPVWEERLLALLALRQRKADPAPALKLALASEARPLQRAAVQWIAEERLTDFRPQIEQLLSDPALSNDLFLAVLAALELLDGRPAGEFDRTPPVNYALLILQNRDRSTAVRTLALRLLDPAEPRLTATLFRELLAETDLTLRQETLRTLALSPLPDTAQQLRDLASDTQQPAALRADALAGLARFASAEKTRDLLLNLIDDRNPVLARAALQALRTAGDQPAVRAQLEPRLQALRRELTPSPDQLDTIELLALALGEDPMSSEFAFRPRDPRGWLSRAGTGGDVAAGRRVFYSLSGGGCGVCHRVNGRGGAVGPDLSTIGRSLSREKLLLSILEPSRDIAPQFVAWTVETVDGKVFTGMIVHENEGRTVLGLNDGRSVDLKTIDIETRTPQQTSVMPEKLVDRLTTRELIDLLAYLQSLK